MKSCQEEQLLPDGAAYESELTCHLLSVFTSLCSVIIIIIIIITIMTIIIIVFLELG